MDFNEELIRLYRDKESYYENIADFTLVNNADEEEGAKKLIALIKKI